MEPSVCGGMPIHAVLREGIAADRIETMFGILNGTSNYILTEIEKHGSAFDRVLAEAQSLGFAEANPSADIDGLDARSKLVLLAAFAFGVRIAPGDVPTEGIRRILPIDFRYAKQLGYTLRLLCSARREDEGLFLSVRPALVPQERCSPACRAYTTASGAAAQYGQDTFYYGQGAGSHPTGVAVVSDMMRWRATCARRNRPRVSPFGYATVTEATPRDIGEQRREWYLRFRVVDRPGIIAALSAILAEHGISIDAVLQLSDQDWRSLPFVITTRRRGVESAPRAGAHDGVRLHGRSAVRHAAGARALGRLLNYAESAPSLTLGARKRVESHPSLTLGARKRVEPDPSLTLGALKCVENKILRF